MRSCLLVFLSCILFTCRSQIIRSDTLGHKKYIRVGIVPYQFLSRSSFVYADYPLTEKMSVGMRAGKVFAQPYVEGTAEYWLGVFGYFLLSGWYMREDVSFLTGKRLSLVFHLNQKFLSFTDQWVPVDHISPASSYSYDLLESVAWKAFGAGGELDFNLCRRGLTDFHFFIDQSFNIAFKHTEYKGASNSYLDYKYHYSKNEVRFNPAFSFGFKIGLKLVKQRKEN